MAWLKLDDQFFRNPKVIAAGKDARDLYLAGLCYCGSNLTDGKIPAGALRMLAAEADIEDTKAAVSSLIDVGLWDAREDGSYEVHDYLEYNPTKERVIATREARAEAGSRGGKQKASNLLEASQEFAETFPKQNSTPSRTRPSPVPVHDPDPAEPVPIARANAPRAKPIRASQVPENWEPDEDDGIWARDEGFLTEEVDRETVKFVRHHRSKGNTFKNISLAWRNWMERSREFSGGTRASPAVAATGRPKNTVAEGFFDIAARGEGPR